MDSKRKANFKQMWLQHTLIPFAEPGPPMGKLARAWEGDTHGRATGGSESAPRGNRNSLVTHGAGNDGEGRGW